MSEEKKVPESFRTYEDRKHRRYSLLFAVNGGAFAVAKLFTESKTASVLGNLTPRKLSIGMILFTVVYDRGHFQRLIDQRTGEVDLEAGTSPFRRFADLTWHQ